MNTILYIVKNHGTLIQVILFLSIILSVWFIELYFKIQSIKDKWTHSLVNISFISTALPLQLIFSLGVVFISSWVMLHNWGLLNLFPHSQSPWVKYFAGFLLLDLLEYCYHVIMHKTGALWRFHLVHHTDEQVDVSTTLREHPMETMIRMCFLMIWVFLSGASIGLLLLRQTIQTVMNLTSHSSFELPKPMERLCSIIFITPGLHHIHHHFELPYTDCNYGDVLSIWDRIFGTYKQLERSHIRYGVDAYKNHSSSRFSHLLKFPFLKKSKV